MRARVGHRRPTSSPSPAWRANSANRRRRTSWPSSASRRLGADLRRRHRRPQSWVEITANERHPGGTYTQAEVAAGVLDCRQGRIVSIPRRVNGELYGSFLPGHQRQPAARARRTDGVPAVRHLVRQEPTPTPTTRTEKGPSLGGRHFAARLRRRRRRLWRRSTSPSPDAELDLDASATRRRRGRPAVDADDAE